LQNQAVRTREILLYAVVVVLMMDYVKLAHVVAKLGAKRQTDEIRRRNENEMCISRLHGTPTYYGSRCLTIFGDRLPSLGIETLTPGLQRTTRDYAKTEWIGKSKAS
jgi:hypothetical protein